MVGPLQERTGRDNRGIPEINRFRHFPKHVYKFKDIRSKASTCECKCSISKMGLILSDKRAAMDEERFNSLVSLSVHTDVEISTDEVIDVFAKRIAL